MTAIRAIRVKFFERGAWSAKSYTYKSTIPYEEGDAVIVPVGEWYAVARVVSVHTNYEWKEGIKYSTIICKAPV
jgi:hypothetical protein